MHLAINRRSDECAGDHHGERCTGCVRGLRLGGGGGSTASIPRLSFSLVKLHHMDAESELFHTETGFLKNSHFMPIA